MSEPAPRLLAGRYQLGQLLGVGGMAEVLDAVDVRLGRAVAVKVLRPELARDPSFQDRFRREAQAAASLSAPPIVSVYDTGADENGAPFIVMERVDGRTLREVVSQEGRLLPTRALEVVADVCAALQVAHEAGIVHRDVKPGNVMLTSTGEVKVMDFGIARALADSSATMTQTASVLGTAAYLSPEQARGEHVDARSDIYSTGCLLYELVTGAPPFTGDSPVAIAYQHVREDPVPPSAYDATLPRDVDAVVLKAMSKNPANRYQSTAEMREDLLRATAGEAVRATPVLVEGTEAPAPRAVPVRPAVRRPSRARRAGIYTLFGLLLLALAASVALLVRGLLGNDTGVVPAPDLIGLTQRQAVDELAERGLRIGRLDTRFAERPVGTVLEQDPRQGFVVPSGGTVDLVLSKGIELTVVPAVVGQSREEASATLSANRLVIGQVVPRDGDLPPGQVLEVQPPAGRQLRPGASVDLVVASGRVEVPDVRGRSQDEAVELLRRAGLSVAVRPEDDPGTPGRVLRQSRVGDRLDRGEVVVLTVSRTPPPPPEPLPEPPPAASFPPAFPPAVEPPAASSQPPESPIQQPESPIEPPTPGPRASPAG